VPIFFVNGTNDFAYPLDSHMKSHADVQQAAKNVRIEVNMPHGHEAGWAPAEIGVVRSAWSDVRVGQWLMPLSLKLAIVAIVAGAAGFGMHTALGETRTEELVPWVTFVKAFVAFVAGFIAWVVLIRAKRVSYVGDDGIAVFTTFGTRAAAKRMLATFGTAGQYVAASSRLTFVRSSSHSFKFGGFSFRASFHNAGGKVLVKLKDKYRDPRQRKPKAVAALAAAGLERGWGLRLARARAELAATGSAVFRTDAGEKQVRLAPGLIRVEYMGGKSVEVGSGSIQWAGVTGGQLMLRYAGDGNRVSVLKLPYDAMPDGPVFDVLLRELTGIELPQRAVL
jgi:hypothetical protein